MKKKRNLYTIRAIMIIIIQLFLILYGAQKPRVLAHLPLFISRFPFVKKFPRNSVYIKSLGSTWIRGTAAVARRKPRTLLFFFLFFLHTCTYTRYIQTYTHLIHTYTHTRVRARIFSASAVFLDVYICIICLNKCVYSINYFF